MKSKDTQMIIYRSADGRVKIDVRMEGETLWLSQAQMVELFQTTKQNISLHIHNIFREDELELSATVKEYLTVQNEGGREISRNVKHYNLDVILAVGYRVKSPQGTLFRQWATAVLHEYLQKGFSINDEALKNMGGGLCWKELLERIRDIRSSINGNNLSNGEIAIKPETKRVTISEYQKYKKELNNRTILVSINGTLGNIAVYRAEKVILGKSACYFNVIDEVDKTFMKYIVSTDVFRDYILRYANGTTIKNVSLKVMREYPFMLPPLPTQRAIAATLSCLDDKIELNNRINANLEAQAQAIFKSWFVDFEPWGGKQPSNWQNYTLGNWLRFINGFAFKSSTYLDIGIYKVITIKNVQDGWVNSAKANCANKLPEGLNPACILS